MERRVVKFLQSGLECGFQLSIAQLNEAATLLNALTQPENLHYAIGEQKKKERELTGQLD